MRHPPVDLYSTAIQLFGAYVVTHSCNSNSRVSRESEVGAERWWYDSCSVRMDGLKCVPSCATRNVPFTPPKVCVMGVRNGDDSQNQPRSKQTIRQSKTNYHLHHIHQSTNPKSTSKV